MKNVFITGGSRGIGSEMVRTFSEAGYGVAFTYKRSDREAEALANETGAIAIKADSSSEEDIKRAVAEAKDSLGHVDVLINNAAISSFRLFTDITTDEWDEMFSVSVRGAFLYSRELLPDMISRKKGRIINVSSMWGVTGSSCEVHYSAAKAAIIGMTKALAKEVGPSGITVNCIAPGVIETDMNASLSPENISALREETPMGRIGSPREVAELALYLASDSASFITGDVININGGMVI